MILYRSAASLDSGGGGLWRSMAAPHRKTLRSNLFRAERSLALNSTAEDAIPRGPLDATGSPAIRVATSLSACCSELRRQPAARSLSADIPSIPRYRHSPHRPSHPSALSFCRCAYSLTSPAATEPAKPLSCGQRKASIRPSHTPPLLWNTKPTSLSEPP